MPVETNSHIEAPPVPKRYTAGLIITRSDRGIWDEVCIRCGLDPRNRRIRYATISGNGLACNVKGQGDVIVEWAVRQTV